MPRILLYTACMPAPEVRPTGYRYRSFRRLHAVLPTLIVAGATAAPSQDLVPHESRAVFNAVREALHEHYYDENLNGLDWGGVEGRYLDQFERARTPEQLRDLIREVLNLVDASHILVSAPDERALTSNILPFVFEHIEGRVFVSGILMPKSGSETSVRFGDEILEVDGADPSSMQPYSLRTNRSPAGNPYFGQSGSIAQVRIRRGDRELTLSLERGRRWSGFDVQRLESHRSGIGVVRLLSIGGDPADMDATLAEAFQHRALVLDLRNNGGGIDQVSQPLLSALVGPGREVDIRIPRETDGPLPVVDYAADPPADDSITELLQSGHRVRMLTSDSNRRFRGPVAVLIGPNTQSQAEAVAAVLKHNGRARLYGRRTAGALSGWQYGIALPFRVGGISIPWYNSAFAGGRVSYEGAGVPPDIEIRNSVSDFRTGNDRVLEAALASLQ